MSWRAALVGHGSIVWIALLAALALPASKLTVSRRSRYMSVHAPSIVVAARAAIVMPRNLVRRMVLSLADVEDVADRCRTAIDASLEAVLHRFGDLPLTEQEEIRVVRRRGVIVRRAQVLVGSSRTHQTRRDDDDQIGFFLLIRGAARERAKHRYVGKPRQLLLIGRQVVLQQPSDREALSIAQLHRGVGAAYDQRGNVDAADPDDGGRIDLADLGLDPQVDQAIAEHRRREGKADTVFLELDRDRAEVGRN